jgi:hypothetical protein
MNPLEALYAQYLSGGAPRQLAPVDVRGPVFAGGGMPDGGDMGMSGFASLGEGVLDYLDREKMKTEGEANTLQQQVQGMVRQAYQPQQPAGAPQGGMSPMGGAPMSPVETSVLPQPGGPAQPLPHPGQTRPVPGGQMAPPQPQQGDPTVPPRAAGMDPRIMAYLAMNGFA